MTLAHILLVEDNADDEALTVRALAKHNVANPIVVAHDGAEAVEQLFAEGAPLPALVLLDLKLPKIDGLEVLRRIRGSSRTRLLPVVVLTSSVQQEDLLSSYEGGANAYVRKPVGFAEFSEAVKTLGMFWLLINESPPLVDAT